MSSKKRKYWNKLRNRYKLTIFNESTYEEVMHLRLSPLHVSASRCLDYIDYHVDCIHKFAGIHPGLPEPTVETSDYTKRSTG